MVHRMFRVCCDCSMRNNYTLVVFQGVVQPESKIEQSQVQGSQTTKGPSKETNSFSVKHDPAIHCAVSWPLLGHIVPEGAFLIWDMKFHVCRCVHEISLPLDPPQLFTFYIPNDLTCELFYTSNWPANTNSVPQTKHSFHGRRSFMLTASNAATASTQASLLPSSTWHMSPMQVLASPHFSAVVQLETRTKLGRELQIFGGKDPGTNLYYPLLFHVPWIQRMAQDTPERVIVQRSQSCTRF